MTAAAPNCSSRQRARGDQMQWFLAPLKPVKLAPFYPGANTGCSSGLSIVNTSRVW
jgi:hypothetical protein